MRGRAWAMQLLGSEPVHFRMGRLDADVGADQPLPACCGRLQHMRRLESAQGNADAHARHIGQQRSEEHTSELQSLMRNSYAVFCLKKKNRTRQKQHTIR